MNARKHARLRAHQGERRTRRIILKTWDRMQDALAKAADELFERQMTDAMLYGSAYTQSKAIDGVMEHPSLSLDTLLQTIDLVNRTLGPPPPLIFAVDMGREDETGYVLAERLRDGELRFVGCGTYPGNIDDMLGTPGA